jgi:hypothetical protein
MSYLHHFCIKLCYVCVCLKVNLNYGVIFINNMYMVLEVDKFTVLSTFYVSHVMEKPIFTHALLLVQFESNVH